MRTRLLTCLTLLILAASSGLLGQTPTPTPKPAPPPSGQAPKFRGTLNEILVDVNVRDKKGEPVENLKAEDFEVFENGKPQEIISFAYEKVAPTASAIVTASTLSKAGTAKGDVPVTMGVTKPVSKPAATATPAPANTLPTTAIDANADTLDVGRGRRPSRVGAVVRHEFDAAGGHSEGRRCRHQVDEREDVDGRPRRDRCHLVVPAGRPGLHERQGKDPDRRCRRLP